MTSTARPHVRTALADDVPAMARVHVRCWQQTYRGLMPDQVLDDAGFVAEREHLWRAALTDDRYAQNRAAVAEIDDDVVGIAMSGPSPEGGPGESSQLFVLYVDVAHHGTGAGADLLGAVLDPADRVALWVADPNPRAQAFYRKHGFTPDGVTQADDFVTSIRMVRAALR